MLDWGCANSNATLLLVLLALQNFEFYVPPLFMSIKIVLNFSLENLEVWGCPECLIMHRAILFGFVLCFAKGISSSVVVSILFSRLVSMHDKTMICCLIKEDLLFSY